MRTEHFPCFAQEVFVVSMAPEVIDLCSDDDEVTGQLESSTKLGNSAGVASSATVKGVGGDQVQEQEKIRRKRPRSPGPAATTG